VTTDRVLIRIRFSRRAEFQCVHPNEQPLPTIVLF
jgi:hypothetical protein